MKVLLVGESSGFRDDLVSFAEGRNWEVIHYVNPVKATDNTEEIAPDVILFNAMDFPRHWKPLLTLLREKRDKRDTVFILLKGSLFPVEEASKAAYLGANGIADADSSPQTLGKIAEIIARYKGNEQLLPLTEKPQSLKPEERNCRIALLFVHPATGKLVTGSVREISPDSISFEPDRESGRMRFKENQKIPDASLRLGSDIHSVDLRVKRQDDVLELEILQVKNVGKTAVSEYIDTVYGM